MRFPSRAITALLVCASFGIAEERALTILHFNDLHAAMTPDNEGRGGIVPLAGTIQRELKGCSSCLVVSAGDFVQGSPVSTIFHGMPVFEIANKMRIDAASLGNHEFDYGWQQAAKFLGKAKFPIVASDLDDGTGKLFGKRPYVILKRNGLRVGVIGLMTEDLKTLTTPATRGNIRTLPLRETVQRYARELRDKTDILVVLAHISPAEEDMILRDVPEAPVVITGHAHNGMEAPKSADNRTLVRVRSNGVELGRLDLQVDTSCKCVKSSRWSRIPVNAKTAEPVPSVARMVAKWDKMVAAKVDVPIGEAKRTFGGNDLKLLIERATVEMLGVDFSFMNRGGVRAPLPAGKLLARHVWNAYPFDNKVVVGRFKGKDLPAVVTEGKQVDPEREYTLAVNDFTAANQQARSQLSSHGLAFPQEGPLQRELLIEWIRKKGVIE